MPVLDWRRCQPTGHHVAVDRGGVGGTAGRRDPRVSERLRGCGSVVVRSEYVCNFIRYVYKSIRVEAYTSIKG